ncbi:MAG: hypothetical protein ABEI57_04380 [Halapricum sp.]
MRVRDYLGISETRQRQLTWVMQVCLVGIVFIGFDRRGGGIILNAVIGLAVVQLPPLLERDYDVQMDAGLTLWITSAVFLHAVGTVGVPGGAGGFYQTTWWWDHLTHALSSSVVAGVGYATARALDEHSDAVSLPEEFVFVFLLMFVLAFGVAWEVIEFSTSTVATALGGSPVMTQYGLTDTMLDLVFDAVGAIVVAVWGTAHLTTLTTQISDRLASLPE